MPIRRSRARRRFFTSTGGDLNRTRTNHQTAGGCKKCQIFRKGIESGTQKILHHGQEIPG
jgi:hypothetical protein